MCQVRFFRARRLGLLACAPAVFLFSGVLHARDAISSSQISINHFIYIIQENHSFDNYFGTCPGADGIKPGTKLADKPGGPGIYKPFHFSGNAIPRDLDHSWSAAVTAYNHGRMDGFVWAEWPAPAASPISASKNRVAEDCAFAGTERSFLSFSETLAAHSRCNE